MLQQFHRWRAQRRADRAAVQQCERFLRAFNEGDTEVIKAMVARRYGRFFAAVADMRDAHNRLMRLLDNHDEDK